MEYPILAPNCTWYKGTAKRATITQINIVNSYISTGNEDEVWNADVEDKGLIKCYRIGTVLTIAGDGSEKIAMNADSSWLFSDSKKIDYFSKLSIINGADILDSSNTTNFARMFQSCMALISVDVSTWTTENVTNMTAMCQNCRALTALEVSGWDVSKVTNMPAMFNNCYALETLNVSSWNVSQVKDMQIMFQNCYKLKLAEPNVSKWNVENVTNMGWMFYAARSIKTLNVANWNVSNVEVFHHFIAHANIELQGLENWRVTNKCRTLNAMFHACANTEIDVTGWDVSNCESFSQVFNYAAAKNIIGLNTWDTSNGLSFTEMFYDCNVVELDLSSFDTRNANSTQTDPDNGEVYGMNRMFLMENNRPSPLKKITFGPNFSFNGNGTCSPGAILPTPSPEKIDGADGNWYDLEGNAYAPADIPSRVAKTYYASMDVIDVVYLTKHTTFLNVAKAIRDKTETTDKFSPNDLVNKINDVFEAGKSAGGGGNTEEAYDQGVEAGKQAEYDSFWDVYQNNGSSGVAGTDGKRTGYIYGFAGPGWTDVTFKPKYNIRATEVTHMFSSNGIVDIIGCLKKAGVTFSTKGMPNVTYILQNNYYSINCPELDLSSVRAINYLFFNCPQLQYIEKIILKEDGSQQFTENYSFGNLPLLKHIRFDGKIGQSINFASSPLLTTGAENEFMPDGETPSNSVQSIIDALMSITDGAARTLTLHQTVRDKLTTLQEVIITNIHPDTKEPLEDGVGWTDPETGVHVEKGKGWTLLPVKSPQ